MPIKSVSHSSELTIELSYTHNGGPLTHISAPAFVHFNAALSQATVYSYDAMATSQNGGQLVTDGYALAGQVYVGSSYVDIVTQRTREAGGATPEPMMGPIYAMPGTGAGQDQQAPGGWFTVCGRWKTKFYDPTNGDYATGQGEQEVNASYAKADIRRTTLSPCPYFNPDQCSTLVWSGYLNADGCVAFNPATGASYQLKMYSQLRKSQGGLVSTSNINYYDAEKLNKGVRTFHRSFNTPPGSGTPLPTTAYLKPPYQSTANAAATMSRVFLLPIAADEYHVEANVGCDYGENPVVPPYDSCAGPGFIFIGPDVKPGSDHPGGLLWKNVIAHEYGHQVQRRMSGVPFRTYTFKDVGGIWQPCNDPLGEDPNCRRDDMSVTGICRCDHVFASNQLHCLQSSETSSAGNAEGFGHFMAARAWNDATQSDCSFNYYKEFAQPGGFVYSPPYTVDCRSSVKWRDNQCFSDARGTEYDWLQFYWNLNTVGSNKMPLGEIGAIHEEACNGDCTSVAVGWTSLRQGALDHFQGDAAHPRYINLRAQGDDFGVDEDQF